MVDIILHSIANCSIGNETDIVPESVFVFQFVLKKPSKIAVFTTTIIIMLEAKKNVQGKICTLGQWFSTFFKQKFYLSIIQKFKFAVPPTSHF